MQIVNYLQACVEEWQEWESWSQCSEYCDGGTHSRARKCNAKCGNGNNEETEECNKQPRPKWSAWSQPSSCDTKSCESPGLGFAKKLRIILSKVNIIY